MLSGAAIAIAANAGIELAGLHTAICKGTVTLPALT
jgi:hypothetical protein